MAARKTPKDLKAMSPEEREAYQKRLEAAKAPKPAYIGYTVNEDQTINVTAVTRSAEEILAAKDAQPDLKYARIMIK